MSQNWWWHEDRHKTRQTTPPAHAPPLLTPRLRHRYASLHSLPFDLERITNYTGLHLPGVIVQTLRYPQVMTSESLYLRAILPSLPSDFAKKVRTLCGSTADSSAEHVLDTLIRFVCGAECSPNVPTETGAQWAEKQQAASKVLRDMIQPGSTLSKRAREDDLEQGPETPKRQRAAQEKETPEDAVFTLHSVSTTSPIRKKVDITLHKTYLRFTHPSTHAVESTIPLSSLTRAFLLPTRGKSKAHWTVVILSSDTAEHVKAPPNPAQSSQQQVIFGVDAITSLAWSTTTHASPSAKPDILPKGSPTRATLLAFLSRLGIQVIEPTPDVFKSACVGITSGVSASEDGIPGIEAYRGAKQGSLWFTKEGILWGESKPCEFWALEDLISKSEGLRVVGASGRTCSAVLTRKSEGEVGDGEEDVGVETQFGLVDARERPGIDGWMRAYRHLFGKRRKAEGGVTIGQVEDDEDEEDENFEMGSDDGVSDGSASSSSSSDEEELEGEDDGNGTIEGEAEEGSEEEEELREEDHPLLRPGAVPRMSRAVIDMVIGMVEEDVMGPTTGASLEHQSEDELEEDELDD